MATCSSGLSCVAMLSGLAPSLMSRMSRSVAHLLLTVVVISNSLPRTMLKHARTYRKCFDNKAQDYEKGKGGSLDSGLSLSHNFILSLESSRSFSPNLQLLPH